MLKEKKDIGITTTELAKASHAHPTLICKPRTTWLQHSKFTKSIHRTARTMKHLAATNIVGELGADHYVATPFCVALAEPKYRDGITYK